MTKSAFGCVYTVAALSLLGVVGCYAKVEVSDSSAEKAIAIDWVEPPCAEPGSAAGYIEGNGFGAENVTITVGGIEAEVLTATGMDASFVVPEGVEPGPVEVVVTNPGGRIATISWVVCTTATFTPLGDLPGGRTTSIVFGLSADSTTAVGSSESESGQEAFRWRNGVMEGLGDLPGGSFGSFATDASEDGSVVVGGGRSADGSEAFRWVDGVMEGLGDLPGGTFSSTAEAVTDDGLVVVGQAYSSDGSEAFRWVDGSMESLECTPDAAALDVSADGSVVVGNCEPAAGDEAFRWVDGSGEGLGYLPGGDFSSARGVSADGSVVVGTSTSANGQEAFRWVDGSMESLGDRPVGAIAALATRCSADCSVVVGSLVYTADDRRAFRWTEFEGTQSVKELLSAAGIDLEGWTLTEARGVSADGTTIAGIGINPDGNGEGWVARLPLP